MKIPVSVGYSKWEVINNEGGVHADDVDVCAMPGAALILVLEVQVVVIAGQFHLG